MSGRITVPAASVIPQGVGAPPPPGLDPKKGKLMCIKVRMLDDTVGVFHLGHKAMGRALFDEVCRHLNLLECDYFGLEFLDITGNRCWLDKEKSILRQITAARSDARFYFVVKFYPPNPTDLEEEYTRYLFALQVKRDLASGQFVVNENTAALMASYIVQSECGDYCSEDYPDHTYLSAVRFIPNQSSEFEKQVMENHKKLIGVSPAESDLNLLETARRAEFYGIKFHPAKDIEGTAVSLCVVHLGIKVYHQLTCANTFSWAKIRKLSFKRRKFLIKLHPESYAYYKDTIEFLFDNRNECKMFWKKCIEHHSFFRCSQMANQSCKQYSKLFPRGSSFRYSGRTHQQLIDYIREHHRRREPFTRPVHSSYNRSAYDDRSLPTPMIPTSHQNGGSGNGAAAQARINGRRGTKSVPMNAADSSLVEDGGSAVAPGSFQGQPSRRKPKEQEQEPQILIRSEDAPVVPVDEAAFFKRSSAFYSSNDSGKSYDLRVESLALSLNLNGGNDGASPLSRTSADFHKQLQILADSVVEPPQLTAPAGAPKKPQLPHQSSSSAREEDFPPPPVTPSTGYSDRDYSSDQGAGVATGSAEKRSKKHLFSRTFHVAKELLMHERTYNNDLNIICKNFQTSCYDTGGENCPSFSQDTKDIVDHFFTCADSILFLQVKFLAELEQKLGTWEAKIVPLSKLIDNQTFKVGDVLLREIHNSLQAYESYLSCLENFLEHGVIGINLKNKNFEAAYKEFENQKLCYVPVPSLLLKPLHRLYSRQSILSKLVSHYIDEGGQNPDLSECKVALDKIGGLIIAQRKRSEKLENLARLIEIECSFVGGIENLFHSNRAVLRQGVLNKLCKRGFRPRLFILLEDQILYADRQPTSGGDPYSLKMSFALRARISLRGLTLEEGNSLKSDVDVDENDNCFTIYGGNKSLVVCASSVEQKRVWMEDISEAVMAAKEAFSNSYYLRYHSSTLKSSSSADELEPPPFCAPPAPFVIQARPPSTPRRATLGSPGSSLERYYCGHHRANDPLRVCWNRSTSLSRRDFGRMALSELSGYLLRKFRNSSGWQRLWVVYCNFCLFFYTSNEDDTPLANLPLLGYSVSNAPEPESNIRKEHVFKLQKNHSYYFRTDSDYSFSRWVECLQSSCSFIAAK